MGWVRGSAAQQRSREREKAGQCTREETNHSLCTVSHPMARVTSYALKELSSASLSSLVHASHSSQRGFHAAVGTALERTVVGLSDAASTTAWKPRSGECLACTRELKSAKFSAGLLYTCSPYISPIVVR